MEYNGLSGEQAQDVAKLLAEAEREREKAEELPDRILYSSVLENMVLEFDSALKDKNFIKLFDLEKICQKYDQRYIDTGNKKIIDVYPDMDELKQVFIESLDPEKVRAKFNPLLDEFDAHGTRVHDTFFETAIRLHSSALRGFVGHRSSPAEKSFYEIRKKCLLALKHEHQRNLDRAVGYEKKKSKSKKKEQEISR